MLIIIGTLLLATLGTGWWAVRAGGSMAVFFITAFVWGVALYFALLLRWLGIDQVFNGASLEGFGVLVLLAASGVMAGISAGGLTTMLHRLKGTASGSGPSGA